MRLDWEPLRGHGLTTGVVRHACRLRRDGTRRFLFGGFFHTLWSGSTRELGFCGGAKGRDAVAVCSEGGCGSMCWPVDRPATHAAAGAAARGVRGGDWGILSHTQERWHEGVGFCFFFGGCSGVGGGFFHMLYGRAPSPRARPHLKPQA